MLIANDIKAYSSFRSLDTEDIYAFEQVKPDGTIVKLRSHHAKRVSNISKYISYLDVSGKVTIADDPTTWSTSDFKAWKYKGKPTSNVPPNANALALLPTGTSSITTAAEKQQKTDDNKLQSLRQGKARKEDYPHLETNEYFNEWKTKMVRQIQLDR